MNPVKDPNDPVGSHHGDPILLERDMKLLADYELWIATARKARPEHYAADWVPSTADCLKSRLFWRIRSGIAPLPYPPPCAYSCPWYELIEDLDPHDCFEPVRDGIGTTTVGAYYRAFGGGKYAEAASVAQDIYGIVRREGDRWLLAFGPYRFWAWNGTQQYPSIAPDAVNGKATRECGWIQRAPELEGATDSSTESPK